jgi:hypothetical protein
LVSAVAYLPAESGSGNRSSAEPVAGEAVVAQHLSAEPIDAEHLSAHPAAADDSPVAPVGSTHDDHIVDAEVIEQVPQSTAQPAPNSRPSGQTGSADPFAGLPRLSPISSELAGLIDPVLDPTPSLKKKKSDAGYVGRRRAESEADAGDVEADAGGGRRRAQDGARDDVLTKIRSK